MEPVAEAELSSTAREIVDAFQESLRRQGSELIKGPDVLAQLAVQVQAVLDDVAARVTVSETSPLELVGEARLFNVNIGADRARRGIHPVQSLRAATTLFEVMLPVITRDLPPTDSAGALRISRALHEAIMARVALASMSYVAFLMEKLQASRQEERTRIARELHDRVLHEMGLTLHQLDLHRHYADRDPAQARAKIDTAIESLDEALRTVRHLSAELRRSVGEYGLERTLRAYLEANAPASVQFSITTTGDLKVLPPDVLEELYLIMREATRNALRHAEPTRLELSVDVGATTVAATVVDDGCGFDTSDPDRARGGLPSMYERALLLHGVLELTSTPGRGTRVEVHIPFSEAAL
ncbi:MULTISPECIES: sensor histidine kinase [unclassified Micromonospora]|uniref:sensor histidine kinase n=1 Tax=unclassified Micromonospora TaxID=2617518 RepID=UPI00104B9CA9|nr:MULTISPECIES: sensor histidine kinase [unclassified Micromonospora]TDB79409.1 sensor histidine kinase [Micromonospora sp. KC721]TDC42157.1 sensor histidine kinase [Micromonospora sp. KC213]